MPDWRVQSFAAPDAWVPVSVAARILNCSTDHIYTLILGGDIRARNQASKTAKRAWYFIHRGSIEDFKRRAEEVVS